MTADEHVDIRAGFVARAPGWLRAGYPAGVPRQDYVALLGLLRRKLTEAEIHAIAANLAAQLRGDGGTISRDDIERMINDSVLQEADDDVARVSARLAAGGWPPRRPAAPGVTGR